ncbi:hypothetical protein BX600DRAFT_451081 [Xylariales sp. PMI_506]|nr:hypothetical protein BX600DRAFT_451081 [Xylariales sp. PMI_506]
MDKMAGTRAALLPAIEAAGTKAFDPASDEASRAEGQREFSALISRTGTPSLIAALNALIKPDRVPRWLRLRLMDILTLLPQRPDGVRATLEFVFSTHPSNAVRASEAADPQKQGANITMEALKMATSLLAIPPLGVTPEQWFPGISSQLMVLLDGDEGPDLLKVAAYVIGYGVLGRRQFGAPGAAGWKAFAEPILSAINPSISSQKPSSAPLVFSAGPDEVVDLQRETLLVRSEELGLALKRLTSLVHSHPNPGLTTRLLSSLILPLWALLSWPEPGTVCENQFCQPAKNLLAIYFKISGGVEKYMRIINDIFYDGDRISDNARWQYDLVGSQMQIKRVRSPKSVIPREKDWSKLEMKASGLVDLLQASATTEDISKVFSSLFQNVFKKTESHSGIQLKLEDSENHESLVRLIEIQVLQFMMNKLSSNLIVDSRGMLELSGQVLNGLDDSPESPESKSIALSLLNIVITAPSFRKENMDTNLLESIELSLDRLRKLNQSEVSQTANNLLLVLKYRDEVDDPAMRPIAPTERQVEDRKTYDLALSYITQIDSPPPVRSEGLNLLSNLIKANSPILDIQGMLVLLTSLLTDEDDYLNTLVMRLFVQLAEKHPKSTTKELVEHYVDANEEASVDTRLRFGEAIIKVVQRLGSTFTGEVAAKVSESLLSVAGRRGYRPKTEAKQEREARLRDRKQQAAEKAWGGDIPDISEVLEETEDEKANNNIISQILHGWESKRGSEDIRIRSSALSIFSIGMETNISGIGPSLIEASVDLCTNILTMEPKMEKAILRRAAIILVLTFVKTLADAREQGRRLGFGLTDSSREDIMRILEYVAQTDNDGLVQQHARDVVESLESWRITSMLPEVQDPTPGIARLAGLDLNLGVRPSLPSTEPQIRPKIEEIE